MALGNPNSSYDNNKKKNYSPSVYSPYAFRNSESVVDKTALTFAFWNKVLKISISPKIDNNEQIATYDYENGISIYLNHVHANILLHEIIYFQQNGTMMNNAGVPSGDGLISISNGKEFGVDSPCIVIRKIDPATLKEVSSFAYQFKQDYYYAIRDYNGSTGDCTKVTVDYDNLEIEQLKTLLTEYVRAMTNAVAYSIIDELKFDQSRTKTKLDLIMNKLGIESTKPRSNNKSSQSAFNRVPTTNTYKNGTIDDIDPYS